MDARTQLRTAYRHARLFRRNILTGMNPDTAKFEFLCVMQAHSISESVWKHALHALDLDALDAFLKAPKRDHDVTWREMGAGQSYCLYPTRKPAQVVVVLEAHHGKVDAPIDLHKPKLIRRAKVKGVNVRLLDTKTGEIFWRGFNGNDLPKRATYPQRASASGWLGWIDSRFADELLEDGQYDAMELTLP